MQRKVRRKTGIVALVLSVSLVSGCSSADTASTGAQLNPGDAISGATSQTSALITRDNAQNAYDFDYSNRDSDPSYDGATATSIVFAGGTATVSGDLSDSATVSPNGATVTITAAGTYLISGSTSAGSLVVDLPGDEDKVQLVLNGASITNIAGPALLIEQADKVFITLASGTTNTLSDGTGRSDITLQSDDAQAQDDDHKHSATLFSHDDLTFNGTGALVVESANAHAISCKDDLVIALAASATSADVGRLTVNAAGDGIKGKDSVKIAAGEIAVTAGDDGITSTNTSAPYEKGFVSIDGGSITVTAGDDGIHAETIVRLAGGAVTVTESYEGIEGAQVWLLDGTHTIKSSDDGINAAGSVRTDYLIDLAGGTLFVDSEGDGLDSNSALVQSGGSVVVAGPTRQGNGALDAEHSALISGGTMLAVDASGMSMIYSASSTQASLLYYPAQTVAAGSMVSLIDSSSKVLFEYNAAKQFSGLAFSAPDLTVGAEYHFVLDGQTTTSFTLDYQATLVAADGSASEYSGQGMMGGPGGRNPGGTGGSGNPAPGGLSGDSGANRPSRN